jgi:hypothetical protein
MSHEKKDVKYLTCSIIPAPENLVAKYVGNGGKGKDGKKYQICLPRFDLVRSV